MAVAALIAVAGCSALASFGCNDIVAGDRASVAQQLCKQLGDCYGEDLYPCDGMENTLREATDEQREAFLGGYSEDVCLGTCPGSLACLDSEPYCKRSGSCAQDEACCKWSLGLSACEGGACCAPRGVACTGPDALECCDAECLNGYCGGQACILVGEECRRHDECCSRRCEDGTCAAKTCADLGEACVSDDDCCNPPSGVVASQDVSAVCDRNAGVCVLGGGTCADAGQACDPNGTGVPCCGELGLACAPGLDGGICGAAGCTGPGIDCAYDGQCCADLICDYTLGAPRCAAKPLVCGKAGDACDPTANDCCPGRECNDGICSEVTSNVCSPGACHDPELVGGAMAVGACQGSPDACCVDLVAQSDSFCRCIAWDLLCAEKAKTECPLQCP
jgi:hypothetical protein